MRTARLLRCGGIRPRQCRFVGHRRIAHQRRRRQLGRNLALAVALSDECRGALESLVLFYPVTKAFADGSESWRKYGSGYGLDADLMEAFNRAYLGGTDSETMPSVWDCAAGSN